MEKCEKMKKNRWINIGENCVICEDKKFAVIGPTIDHLISGVPIELTGNGKNGKVIGVGHQLGLVCNNCFELALRLESLNYKNYNQVFWDEIILDSDAKLFCKNMKKRIGSFNESELKKIKFLVEGKLPQPIFLDFFHSILRSGTV